MKEKTCTKCGKAKPLSEFGKHSYSKDGHAWRCLECSRKQAQKYRQTPRGIFTNMMGPNRFWNRHVSKITRDKFVKWYNLQERTCVYCDLLESDLVRCGDPINMTTRRLSVDCKDNTLGYVEGNLVLACLRCNNIKSDLFTFNQMREIAQKYTKPLWESRIASEFIVRPKRR